MTYTKYKLLKFSFLCLIFIFNICIANENFYIKKIKFIGLYRISCKELIPILPVKENQVVNSQDVKLVISTLFNTKYFNNIQVYKDIDNLIIKLKEKPLIREIKILGNTNLKTEILEENFKKLNFTTGEMLDKVVLHRLKTSIKKYYDDIGKFKNKVKVIIHDSPNNQVKINFIINEGKTARIKKLNILGNKEISKREILSFLKLRNKKIFKFFYICPKFNRDIFNKDLDIINNLYLNKGYAFFKIYSTYVNLISNNEKMIININIHEGNKYNISKIEIDNNLLKEFPEIKNIHELNYVGLYNHEKVKNLEKKIRKLLYSYGYINHEINILKKVNESEKSIVIIFKVDKKNKFYVNKINILGNYNTRDLIVRRIIQQKEKSIFNKNLIKYDKINISKLDYFNDIEVKIKKIPFTENQVNLEYQLKEKNFRNLNAGIGFNNNMKLNFNFNFQENNLFGNGFLFNTYIVKNESQTSTELLFSNPYLFNKNINQTGKISYKDIKKDNIQDYDLKNFNINTNIGIPYKDNIFNLGLEYSMNIIKNINKQIIFNRYIESINSLNHQKKFNILNSNDFFLLLGWNSNSLDSNIFPNKGLYIKINNKLTVPGSNNNYFKSNIEFNNYTPIKNLIFMNKTELGFTRSLNKTYVPFYEYYKFNNSSRIRGFQNDTIGPKSIYFQEDKKAEYGYQLIKSENVIGGDSLFIYKTEIILPQLYKNNQYSNLIRVSLFLDAGIIWDNSWKNKKHTILNKIPDYSKFNKIRISSGVAFKCMSPLGPITLSYAKIIKKCNDDKIENFQFNFGETW